MKEIVIEVEDQSKAKLLIEMLESLSFVSSIHVTREKSSSVRRTLRNRSVSFFDYAGLWEGRQIDQTILREKAWPQRKL